MIGVVEARAELRQDVAVAVARAFVAMSPPAVTDKHREARREYMRGHAMGVVVDLAHGRCPRRMRAS